MVSDPKIHHYVPRFYLRGFADTNDRLAVRERQGRTYVTSTNNVMARSGLYRAGNANLTAEYTLADIEGMASTIVSALRDGRLPPSGSSGRTILAIFMAVQIARNLTIMPPLGYYSELFDTFESLQVGTEDVRSYLTRAYGFTPAISEVEAATRVAEIGASTFLSTDDLKDFMLTTLFNSVKELAPFLEARQWSLEASKRQEIITSDRPVVLWNPPSEEDNYRGVGVADTEEIWFPVDRKRILVLRISGSEIVRRIGPERVDEVNEHIARHCTERIVSHPSASNTLAQTPLATRRPTIRFSQGPAFDRRTGDQLAEEIIHSWLPIRDIPDGVERDSD